jgi:hypothetical protein
MAVIEHEARLVDSPLPAAESAKRAKERISPFSETETRVYEKHFRADEHKLRL